jgi:hypothetical protein
LQSLREKAGREGCKKEVITRGDYQCYRDRMADISGLSVVLGGQWWPWELARKVGCNTVWMLGREHKPHYGLHDSSQDSIDNAFLWQVIFA